MASRRVRENRRTWAYCIEALGLLVLSGLVPNLLGEDPAYASTPARGWGAPEWLMVIPLGILAVAFGVAVIHLTVWLERRNGWRQEHLRAIRAWRRSHR